MLETRQLILRDLADRNAIDDADIAEAHRHAADHQVTILRALVEIRRISERELALAHARVSEHPFVDLNEYQIDLGNAGLFPAPLARRAGVFPLFVIDGVATVAMLDPHDLQSLERVRQATHLEIDPVVCEESLLRSMIESAYGHQGTDSAHTPTNNNETGSAERNSTTTNAAVPVPHDNTGPIDHEHRLAEQLAKPAGLILLTARDRAAITQRLSFHAASSGHREAAEIPNHPAQIRAAADSALAGNAIIATMTAADAADAFDRIHAAGVTPRTVEAIDIAVFHHTPAGSDAPSITESIVQEASANTPFQRRRSA